MCCDVINTLNERCPGTEGVLCVISRCVMRRGVAALPPIEEKVRYRRESGIGDLNLYLQFRVAASLLVQI